MITEEKLAKGVINNHSLQVAKLEGLAVKMRGVFNHIPADRLVLHSVSGMFEGLSVAVKQASDVSRSLRISRFNKAAATLV